MYGDLATTSTAVSPNPARMATPRRLKRARKFALRSKICAMSELRPSSQNFRGERILEIPVLSTGERLSGSPSDRLVSDNFCGNATAKPTFFRGGMVGLLVEALDLCKSFASLLPGFHDGHFLPAKAIDPSFAMAFSSISRF